MKKGPKTDNKLEKIVLALGIEKVKNKLLIRIDLRHTTFEACKTNKWLRAVIKQIICYSCRAQAGLTGRDLLLSSFLIDELHVAFVDCEKAFDRVQTHLLWQLWEF